MVFSVIIPAYNEEAVIGACLSSLLEGSDQGDLEIIVVPNGCTDATAEVVRTFGSAVVVAETPVPSKWRALNIGDRLATGFPRLYVDADVSFSFRDARKVVEALERGALAAAPELRLDTSKSSRLVRSHLRIWERLPVIKQGLMGRGVYGLSATGRSRFDEFPDMIADDHYVHHLFTPGERVIVEGAVSTVRAPRRIRDLIQRKIRSYAGLMEAQRKQGEERSGGSSLDWLVVLRSEPLRIIDLPSYLGVSIVAKLWAMRRQKLGRAGDWDRDTSTRDA